MIKKKTTLIYCFLLLCILISSALILKPAHKTRQAKKTNTLNAIVTNAEFKKFNSSGLLVTQINAEKVTHFEENKTTFFKQPQIIFYKKNKPQWHIAAKKGKSVGSGSVIILTGNVIIRQLPNEDHPGTLIKTSEMTIYKKDSRAETQSPVVIYRKNTVIHGKGLIANLKTGTYQLRSESTIVYQPHKIKKTP